MRRRGPAVGSIPRAERAYGVVYAIQRRMADNTKEQGAQLGDLVKEAITDVEELVKIEVALAQQELRHDARRMKDAAIAFAVAASLALLGLAMLLVALLIAIKGGFVGAIVMGLVLLGFAIIAGVVGYRLIPSKPGPDRTMANIEKQAKLLKERIA